MIAADIIHLLPDSVANQIAAGEVIQRPASVVKELVENSIDAGAKHVQIIIKDAGRTLIQVVDDGCGMSMTDARMAFERHATSKIQQASDLFALHTMGFRGEALPSVAAVSEIEMRTMRKDDEAGTRIQISASHVQNQEPDLCAVGTNIMVKKLFFNLPARRKFLKKDAIELGHIAREFERLALVNTSVAFTLIHNDVVLHQLQATTLKQRICDLFGKSLDHQLIPVNTETSLVRIEGFIGLPMNARRRGALQYFFVNGRNMRHPYFHKAILSSYENLISPDVQPSYFINFQVDPETIDVNIHPQKYEIKFENEQPVWQILSACVKESLGRFNATAAIDFDSIDAPDIPALNPENKDIEAPELDIDYHFNPFKEEGGQRSNYSRNTGSTAPPDWEKLYEGFTKRQEPTVKPSKINEVTLIPDSPTLIDAQAEVPSMLQFKNRYIVLPARSGLMMIDQHRAHIRIIYDKQMAMATQSQPTSQRLIFPDSVTFDPAQNIVVTSIQGLLDSMGFEITCLGSNSWAINSVPPLLGNSSASQALINIVEAVSAADENVEQSQWHSIVLSMAKSAALKYGAALTQQEMDSLVSDLFRLPTPDYTPDGKPIIWLIGNDEITKRFS